VAANSQTTQAMFIYLAIFFLISAVVLQSYIVSRMKLEEPGIYAQVGSPAPFFSDGKNFLFAITFILTLRYRQVLKNSRLLPLCSVDASLLAMCIVCTIASIFE
jgi:hypothetical protein